MQHDWNGFTASVYVRPFLTFREMETTQVILAFLDRHREEVTAETAWKLCSDPKIAGNIIDAITDNKALQAALRAEIDKF
jgi:hypothetical protein